MSAGGGVGVAAVPPGSPAEFYRAVWQGKVGDRCDLIARRDEDNLSVTLRGEDRRTLVLSLLQERRP